MERVLPGAAKKGGFFPGKIPLTLQLSPHTSHAHREPIKLWMHLAGPGWREGCGNSGRDAGSGLGSVVLRMGQGRRRTPQFPIPNSPLQMGSPGSADGWRDPGWICVGIGAQDGILWELRGWKKLGGLSWDLCRKEGEIPELFSRKNIPAEDEERAAGF